MNWIIPWCIRIHVVLYPWLHVAVAQLTGEAVSTKGRHSRVKSGSVKCMACTVTLFAVFMNYSNNNRYVCRYDNVYNTLAFVSVSVYNQVSNVKRAILFCGVVETTHRSRSWILDIYDKNNLQIN